ncbi:AzlD domain-containing protein [Anoxybacillus flavithermus]|uniref:AzlD domain-containing protein n=1 Tax=Anoxybacillus flavithermus TaxID=33934 RepID=A0A2G5RU20_9BACL|nr:MULTISPECIES: AzlD domain-containing protein [Anoxybacillus]KFZ42245.1 branched-chain amino acid transporter [Anoxybacillus sp. KU2-6(11)]PIC06294.1 AzlD domain-containing protein [Anoxybacillus flavithermus]
MRSDILFIILGMGIVTYIPRMLPLTVFHRIHLPPFWRGVLRNVPYATLGALIIPGMFLIQDDLWFGILGFVSAVFASWLGANVMIVVFVSVLVLTVYTFI